MKWPVALRQGCAGVVAWGCTVAAPAAAPGRLPDGTLVCAFSAPKIGLQGGEAAQYSLLFSAMGSLTLHPAGSYSASRQTAGRFVRVGGDKIRLTSGTWAGALGTLESDRSGAPAVVFHRDENRRQDGVHIIDPYTTRCTKPR